MRYKSEMKLCIKWTQITFCIFILSCSQIVYSNNQSDVELRDFFKEGELSYKKLPADEFYPNGRNFLFSIFSVLSPDLEKLKADGFTAIGPYYGDQVKGDILGKANLAGLKCIYRIGFPHLDFHNDPNYVMPTEEQYCQQLRKEMELVLSSSEVAIWYFANEEIRWWIPDEFKLLQMAYKIVKETDPKKRPFWMYEPNHRPAEGLAKTVAYQDYCGKGFYATLAGYQNNRIWIKWSIDQEKEAIKLSGNEDVVPLCVPEMCCDPEPEYNDMIKKWCRHDIYCSLINGAKGVVIWSGFRRGGFSTYDLYYDGYSSVSKELNGELQLGQVFLFGTPKKRLRTEIIDGVKAITMRPTIGNIEGIEECIRQGRLKEKNIDYSPISTSELIYEGNVYYFMVNSTSAYIKTVTYGFPQNGFKVEELFEGEDVEISKTVFRTDFEPYGLRCYRFSPN